jgi:hypothetical protein
MAFTRVAANPEPDTSIINGYHGAGPVCWPIVELQFDVQTSARKIWVLHKHAASLPANYGQVGLAAFILLDNVTPLWMLRQLV